MERLRHVRAAVLPLVLIGCSEGGTNEAPSSLGVERSAVTQAYTWKNVEIVGGGFVPGIVYSRAEANLVYARTDIGGAYRLDAGTGRWLPLLDGIGWDDWNLTGVASLATDPVDPNRLYLAVGTYTNAWTTQNGAILSSSDRGASFSRTDLPFKLGGNMPGRGYGGRQDRLEPGGDRRPDDE